MSRLRIHFRSMVLALCIACFFSCDDDDEATTFSGTVVRESDKQPATGLTIVILGYDVDQSQFPMPTVALTRNMIVVDSEGKFRITVPRKSKVDMYTMHGEHATRSSTIEFSSGCDWPCGNFKPGSDNKFTLEIQL